MFKGKVVAITGAGSGIGRALATEMAPLGARLALADINPAALGETMQLLPAGTDARAYALDVSSREAVFRFAADVQRDFGAAHFIFNNAGTGVFATVENTEIEEIEKVLNINLWGTIYGTKAFLPIMLAQKEGCIINISSGFGLIVRQPTACRSSRCGPLRKRCGMNFRALACARSSSTRAVSTPTSPRIPCRHGAPAIWNRG